MEQCEFWQILLDDCIEDVNVRYLTQDMVQMKYHYCNEFVDSSNTTNVYIAGITSAHAHMKLYECLEQLGDCVCYFDTDCVK